MSFENDNLLGRKKQAFEKDKQVVECPNCSFLIVLTAQATTAKCPSCGSTIAINAPKPPKENFQAKIAGISTLSSARAHIEFSFDNYDWNKFAEDDTQCTIPELDALLVKMKTEQGDQADTWVLCFDTLCRCLMEKSTRIKKGFDDIVENFARGKSLNACYNEFANYHDSCKNFIDKRETYLQELRNDMDYARRFGLNDADFEKMKAKFDETSRSVLCLAITNQLESYPEIANKLSELEQEQEKIYLEKNIDARKIYEEALEEYNQGHYQKAIAGFQMIRDYKDSNLLLNRMRHIEKINSTFFIHQKPFYYNNGFHPYTASLIDEGTRYTGLSGNYIGIYGDRYYYYDFNNHTIVHSWDMSTLTPLPKKEKKWVIPTLSFYGKKVTHLPYNPERPNTIVFCVSYDPIEDKKAKLAFLKTHKLKSSVVVMNKITYKDVHDYYEYDCETKNIVILLEGVKEVIHYKGNVINYLAYLPVMKKSKLVDFDGIGLYSYQTVTKEKKLEITGDSRIVAINPDQSIVFTRNDHGSGNCTIFTKKSLEDNTENIVAKNVFQFYKIIQGKIFYLMGNSQIKSLCSINIDGTGFVEVIKYMKSIAFSDENYLYTTSGDNVEGYRTLYRISVTGGKPEKVAFGIHESDLEEGNRLIYQGYLYYTNYANILCRVRLNGRGYQEILRDVAAVVTIHCGKIFYLAIDGKDEGNKTILSLYDMQMDGSNRQKLVYHLSSIELLDENTIVYERKDELFSKRELYKEITDKKVNKQIEKMYKVFAKKKVEPEKEFMGLYRYHLEEDTTELVAYEEELPNVKSLKVEMKEVLKRK